MFMRNNRCIPAKKIRQAVVKLFLIRGSSCRHFSLGVVCEHPVPTGRTEARLSELKRRYVILHLVTAVQEVYFKLVMN